MPRNSLETKAIHLTHWFGPGIQAVCSDGYAALDRVGLATPLKNKPRTNRGGETVLETVQWTVSGSNGRSPGGGWILRDI